MNKIYFLLLTTILAFCVEGRVFRIIDDFTDTPYTARYSPALAEVYDTVAPFGWYSPYDSGTAYTQGIPFTNFRDVTNVMGGQRDIIVGHVSSMRTRASIACSVNAGVGTTPPYFQLALPTNFLGGIYLQYDGDDDTSPSFGAILHTSIGAAGGPGANADGQTIDFTFAGAARGILVSVQTDLTIFYELKAVNIGDDTTYYSNSATADGNTIEFVVQRNENSGPSKFYFTYADSAWQKTPLQFDWTRVAGFQIKVFTSPGSPTAQSLDSRIFLIQIATFEVGGKVRADCLCDNIGLVPLSGIRVDLFTTTPSVVLRESATTDINGDYRFASTFTSVLGKIDVTAQYQICLFDTTLTRCPNTQPLTSNSCYPFTALDPFVDLTSFDFTISRSTSLNIPDDVDIECATQSTEPPVTGNAQVVECDGTTTTLTTWIDTPSGNACVTTYSRQWTSTTTGATGIQRIVVRDTTRPSFSRLPANIEVSCANPSVSMNVWVNTRHADAIGTDTCSTVTIISDWDNIPVTTCGVKTVNFRVRDACGLLSDPAPASYTVTDGIQPTFSTNPQPLTIECNFKVASSNPNTQINSWLLNHGNAVATDNCSTQSALTWDDSFSGTTITSSNACSFSETVTFFVYDTCGSFQTATAIASVRDSQGPTFTRQAQPAGSQCATDGSNNTAFQTWLTAHGNAIATDDCISSDSLITWDDDYTGGVVGGSCTGSVTVTFTAFDACLQSRSTTATFSITDSTAPVITTQASNANPTCDGNGNNADWTAFISSHGGAVASDNCGVVTWSDNAPASPPTACGQSVTVTFTAFQQCTPQLSAQTLATYTIRDNVPPIWTRDPDPSTVVECGPTAPAAFTTWLANNANAQVSDVCSNINLRIDNNFVPPNLVNGCNNVATVTFTGVDGCGNRNNPLTGTFAIRDTQAPQITTQAQRNEIDCDVNTNQQQFNTWRNNHGGAVATDCQTVTWSFNDTSPIGNGCNVERYVEFTASDPCLQSSRTTAAFLIIDDSAPTITRQASPGRFECDGNDNRADIQNFLLTQGGATATDNCGAVTWSNDFTALSSDCTQSTIVTFTATDPCNLRSTTTTTLTVTDTSAPIINPRASDAIVDCNTETNSNDFQAFLDNRGGARATDLCQSSSSLVWTNSQTPAPVGCNSVNVIFTVTDACQQSTSTSARFTIVDDDGPTITQNPSSISVECNGSGNREDYSTWLSSRGGATAIDACSTSLIWTNNAPTTGPVGCGTVPVVFTVSDQCDNSVSVTASFTVIDSSPPAILTPAQNVTVPCDGRSNNGDLETWLLNHGNAVAQDTCYATNTLLWRNDFIDLSSSDRCTQYVDVVFQVVDGCGQRAQTVGTYTIKDSTPPILTRPAENRFYECNSISNQDDINIWILVNGAANAIDTCSEIEWSNDFDLVYPLECQGPKAVTFTATDLCGLSISTTATVEIDDTIPPIFLNFPRDVILTCADPTDPAWTRSPDAFDSYCDNELEPTYIDSIFQEPSDRFCPGDYIITRTWYLFDDCANGVSRNQTITVTLPDGPCTFNPCPDCDDEKLCCESSLEPVPCTPVPCNPVGCNAVDCTIVPCLPKVCGSAHVPIYDDDDGPIFTSPIPVAETVTCEPIYVYVFDDDENNAEPVESANSSSFIVASFTLILSIFFLMI